MRRPAGGWCSALFGKMMWMCGDRIIGQEAGRSSGSGCMAGSIDSQGHSNGASIARSLSPTTATSPRPLRVCSYQRTHTHFLFLFKGDSEGPHAILGAGARSARRSYQLIHSYSFSTATHFQKGLFQKHAEGISSGPRTPGSATAAATAAPAARDGQPLPLRLRLRPGAFYM